VRPAPLRVREVDRRTESAIAALRRLPYQEYLRTAHWFRVSTLALERGHHRCALCPAERELEVHHRNYARRGFEQSEHVVVLCRPCHQLHHGTLRHVPVAPSSGLRWLQTDRPTGRIARSGPNRRTCFGFDGTASAPAPRTYRLLGMAVLRNSLYVAGSAYLIGWPSVALRERTEIQALLRLAAEQRRRLKEIEATLEDLYRRIGVRIRARTDAEADPRSGKDPKTSRKK
jgi:hypothetical protein